MRVTGLSVTIASTNWYAIMSLSMDLGRSQVQENWNFTGNNMGILMGIWSCTIMGGNEAQLSQHSSQCLYLVKSNC